MFRPVLKVGTSAAGRPRGSRCRRSICGPGSTRPNGCKFREAGSLLGVLSDADGPIIAMGDFNALAPDEATEANGPPRSPSRPEDHVAGVRGGVIGAILDAGFVDSYRLIHPYEGQQESTLLARAGWRVDYIFVNSLLQPYVSSSYILDNEAVRKASDHRPVVPDLAVALTDDLGALRDGEKEAAGRGVPGFAERGGALFWARLGLHDVFLLSRIGLRRAGHGLPRQLRSNFLARGGSLLAD